MKFSVQFESQCGLLDQSESLGVLILDFDRCTLLSGRISMTTVGAAIVRALGDLLKLIGEEALEFAAYTFLLVWLRR